MLYNISLKLSLYQIVRASSLPFSEMKVLLEYGPTHSFVYVCGRFSEKAMAPHSSTLAWKIPRTEEPGRLQSWGREESDTTERLHFHFSLSCIGEGNGNPLQCSCLGNPKDGGAWWAAIYGVTELDTTEAT